MTDLAAEHKALAEYRPTNKVRFVTAAALFDGHDAAIKGRVGATRARQTEDKARNYK